MYRRFLRSTLALAVVGLLAGVAPAGATKVVPRPVLGDWEGVGPHGLPLTFVLARRHGRIVLRNLAVGFPLNCPGKPTPTVAVAYKIGRYGGPGAQPRVRLPGWRPTDIIVTGYNAGQFPLELGGRLLSRRHMTLTMGVGPRVPKNCGWPRKLIVWSVRPANRLAVAAGTWVGPVTVPGGTGTATVKVTAAGRIVDVFKVQIMCTEGGGGSFSSGPPAEEFISASGAFEGWGYGHWKASFGADGMLTGQVVMADYCTNSGGQVTGTFTAQRSGP